MDINRKVYNHIEEFFTLRLRTRKKNCTGIAFCVTFWFYICVCVRVRACARCRFLGAFAKLRIVTVSFVMSVCQHGTTRLPLHGFLWNLTFEYFSKICRENSSFFKISQTLFHVKPCAHLSSKLNSLLEWEIRRIKVGEKIKTHIIECLLRKSYRLWANVEKCGRAGQATADDIIRCMRVACWITKATDTHSEYVMCEFSRQPWLRERTWMVRLYVHCLSWLASITNLMHNSFILYWYIYIYITL
jgi:hypothetical protein